MAHACLSPVPRAAGLLLAIVSVVACGGAVSAPVDGGPHSTAPDAGSPLHPSDDSGAPPVGCGLPIVRPAPSVCQPTGAGVTSGAVTCVNDGDCSDAGPQDTACFHGHCGGDGCSTDADCPTGLACECAIQFQGNGIYANRCVTPVCSVDADCGKGGGPCAPAAPTTACGGFFGSYCHRPADTCTTSADCCGDTPICTFDPNQGHWACVASQTCSG